MLKFSKKTNLLEQSPHQYAVEDVSEPNLHREIYRYSEIPKVPFDYLNVPINMPDEIWLTDTTFRDGQQAVEPYTIEQIVKIYNYLSRLSGPKGKIRQTEFFVYSKKDIEAIEKCRATGLKFPEITTWIRAKKEDLKIIRDLGIKETGILTSVSDYHIFKKLGISRTEAMSRYLDVIMQAISYGIVPRCHLEDITRADFHGFVIPFISELQKISEATECPIKFRICDTMGYGVPFAGAALPRSVSGIVHSLRNYCDVPAERLEWHGHNDFYKAVANATTAWLYGCASVNCSIFGRGERTGNIPIEAMVFEYASLRGDTDGMDTTVITEIADYYRNEIGYKVPENTPFVGEHFNMTRAGIHADGLLKDEEIYNIFDTKTLLNNPPHVQIGPNSGAAGIAYWINSTYSLSGKNALKKTDSLVAAMKLWVDEQYSGGRQTVLTKHELETELYKLTDGLMGKL